MPLPQVFPGNKDVSVALPDFLRRAVDLQPMRTAIAPEIEHQRIRNLRQIELDRHMPRHSRCVRGQLHGDLIPHIRHHPRPLPSQLPRHALVNTKRRHHAPQQQNRRSHPHAQRLAPYPVPMHLFSPLEIRGITFRNRIAVSPMCEYSCEDGFANDWHLVHLGSRAVGGAALVLTEATAVEERGQISPADLGIWKDDHIEPLARIAAFIRSHGAVPGIQLAHAGRKASTSPPWRNSGALILPENGGWTPVAPSPIPFREDEPPPAELTRAEIAKIVARFRESRDSRPRCRVPGNRNPRRPRLPARRIPFPAR